MEITPPASSLHILVVDDEPSVLEVLSAYLSEEGHRVETAANGIEGWRRFQNGTWDVILTDRVMPGMTGEQFAAAIKERSPHMPVVMVTGIVDSSLATPGKSPIDVIVRKPFTLATLRKAIDEARAMHSRDVTPPEIIKGAHRIVPLTSGPHQRHQLGVSDTPILNG